MNNDMSLIEELTAACYCKNPHFDDNLECSMCAARKEIDRLRAEVDKQKRRAAELDSECDSLADDWNCLNDRLLIRDRRIAELEAALNRVKTHCAGDAMPRWDCTPRTTASRGYIMDVCDAALSGGGK